MPGAVFFQQLGLYVVPEFLAAEAGADLCRQMASAPVEKALVFEPNGMDILDENSRKVESSILCKGSQSPLRERLRGLIPELERHFGVPLVDCESLQYLTYRPGHFFKPHKDSGYPESGPVGRRRVSAVIFLNGQSENPADGTYGQGQLNFYGLIEGPHWEKVALPLDAEPGLLVAFPSDKLHEVTPVTHGTRFTVVTWFYGPEPPKVPERAD